MPLLHTLRGLSCCRIGFLTGLGCQTSNGDANAVAVVVNREGQLQQTVASIASVIDAVKLSVRHRSRKGQLSNLPQTQGN